MRTTYSTRIIMSFSGMAFGGWVEEWLKAQLVTLEWKSQCDIDTRKSETFASERGGNHVQGSSHKAYFPPTASTLNLPEAR